MGNTPISVGLETDQSQYSAGDTLRGKVYLSVSNKQAREIAAQSLQIKLIGKESAVVHHTSNGEGGNENHYESSNHVFFNLDYPLRSYVNQTLPVGQYEYPFSLALPQNLPSSFSIRKGESHAEVEYELVAELRQPGLSNTFFGSNPQATKVITLQSTYSTPVADTSVQHPLDIIPVTCCCSNRGTMALEVGIDKTVVSPFDQIGVSFRFRNNSSSDVSVVSVGLEQIIDWKCRGHSKKVEHSLDKKKLGAEMFPELEANLPKPPPLICCIRHRGYHNVSQEIPLTQEWRTAKLRIPNDAKDTYPGKALNVRHVVTVTLKCHGCCMNNPESSTSVHLVRNFSSAVAEMEGKQGSINLKSPAAPSAPPDMLNNNAYAQSYASAQPTAPAAIFDDQPTVIAEAQALPPGWNAQTADVVEIPMAQAFVIENVESK